MVAWMRNGRGWRALWLLILVPLGCARSAALPPPAARPMPPPAAPAVVMPPPAIPNLNVQTDRDLWRPSVKARDWKYIVIHHTASERGSVDSIHEEHLKKKDASGKPWLGIGYHFLIGNGNGMPDGEVEATFRWRTQIQGAHAGSSDPVYNQQGIGICLVGNFQDHAPSSGQMTALKKLVRTLKTEYRVDSKNIIGHRDVRATECPGKLFPMEEVANVPIDFQFSEAMPAETGLRVVRQNGIYP